MLTQEMLKTVRVFLKPGATDMRKQVNGLSLIVQDSMELDPLSGNLFVFCNKRKRILKILYWDRNGFCLWHKRLEEEKFKWPRNANEVMEIGYEELSWLLRGLDFKTAHKKLQYSSVA